MNPALLVPVAVLAGLVTLLHRRLVSAPGWTSRPLRWAIDGLVVAVLGAVVAGEAGWGDDQLGVTGMRRVTWFGMTGLGMLWYVVIGLLLTATAALVVRVGLRVGVRLGAGPGPDAAQWRHHRRAVLRRLHRVTVPLVAGIALVVTAYGLVEARQLRVVEVEVPVAGLPSALAGLRIAQITDLHAGPIHDDDVTAQVVDLTMAQRPDLIALTGDLVDGSVQRNAGTIASLGELAAPLGVYAVSGNHEFYTGELDAWLASWERIGVTVLRNASVRLTVPPGAVGVGTADIETAVDSEAAADSESSADSEAADLVVAGIHDLTGTGDRPGPEVAVPVGSAPDVAAALAGTSADDVILLLAHQPVQAQDATGRGVDLQLSGHTHGGQLWPFHYLVGLQQPTLYGLDLVADIPVFTSRGAGTWGPPMRVAAPPEVAILTLRPADGQRLG